jgi:sugar lactone lactonase YvrE
MNKKTFTIPFLLFLVLTEALAQPEGELFFKGDMPMGNVAVNRHPDRPMQYFFTIHPESKPDGPKVFEIRNGEAVPFPDSAFQEEFISPLGIYLDNQQRLWVLDHANYALKTPRLFAFDAASGELLIEQTFDRETVRKWVMLNDLSVSPDGNTVVISAPGMFKKRSSIIVYDVRNKLSRRILTDHISVMRKKFLPEVDGKKMRFLLGLLKVRPGVDGIDIDPRGRYVYYGAMADTLLYRLPVDAAADFSLPDSTLGNLLQRAGSRPLCDGIRLGQSELVYLTDFQQHRILAMDWDGNSSIVLQNKDIRWADGLSVGADGYLYITDSALQHVILKKRKKFSVHAPFGIWRVKVAPDN